MSKLIVITGPESTGKTTLAGQLSKHFSAIMVEEYARQYIDDLDRDYRKGDLLKIAKGQWDRQEEARRAGNDLVVVDTSLLNIKIWSTYKYGHCHYWILDHLEKQQVDGWILCDPSIPWEFDPQRENLSNRDELYDIFLRELTAINANILKLKGDKGERLEKAINWLSLILRTT